MSCCHSHILERETFKSPRSWINVGSSDVLLYQHLTSFLGLKAEPNNNTFRWRDCPWSDIIILKKETRQCSGTEGWGKEGWDAMPGLSNHLVFLRNGMRKSNKLISIFEVRKASRLEQNIFICFFFFFPSKVRVLLQNKRVLDAQDLMTLNL